MARVLGEVHFPERNDASTYRVFSWHDAMLSVTAEPATKKQKVSPAPLASQDSQSSFADVLARIQIDSQESTSAFFSLDPRHR